ncbi:Protein of unknown function [Bacillus mycoides]|nr:Protein of unknown function [Bacillus mycoides]
MTFTIAICVASGAGAKVMHLRQKMLSNM